MSDTRSELQKAIAAWVAQNPLRRWRKARNMTLHQVATVTRCAVQTIQFWETGALQPNTGNMGKLATILGDPRLLQKWQAWRRRQPSTEDGSCEPQRKRRQA